MNKIEKKGLCVYQFGHNDFSVFNHGVFTRKGGKSSGIFSSLNLGSTVGDDQNHVNENKKAVLDFFGRDINTVYEVWQVHGNEVICTNNPRVITEPHIKADAIFTNNPDLTLLMRFADCVPIFLCDPVKKVAGIIHAGWKGTLNNIVKSAIETIEKRYGCNARDLVAGIGPSIGPDHYAVGPMVVDEAKSSLGDVYQDFFEIKEGEYFLNLWKTNEYLLRRQGVKKIEVAKICTACNLDEWYSHRKENGKTGRFGALIFIRKE